MDISCYSSSSYRKISQVSHHVAIATCLVAGIIFSILGMNGIPFNPIFKSIGPYLGVGVSLPLIIFAISTCKVKFNADQKKPEPIVEPQTPVSIAIKKQREALEEWFKRDVSNPGDENWELHANNGRRGILKAIEFISEDHMNEVWVFSPGDLEPFEELEKSFKTVRLLGSSPKIDSKENCVRLDFLQNVRDEIDKIFKKNLPKDQCLAEFNQLKTTQFNFTEKFPKSRPDYIVCSLVMTEFHVIEQYFSKIFQEIYAESPPKSWDLYKNLALQWISVLANLVKPGGALYFADTVAKHDCLKHALNRRPESRTDMIHFDLEKNFTQIGLTVLETKKWLWTIDMHSHWEVWGFILIKNGIS